MSSPSFFKEIRGCLYRIQDPEMQMFFKSIYLFAARGYELTRKQNSRPAKIFQQNFRLKGVGTKLIRTKVNRRSNELEDEEIALFQITFLNIESNQLLQKTIGLPLEKKYEPLTKELYTFYSKKGENYAFPFNSEKAWRYATSNRIFEGRCYDIKGYDFQISTEKLGIIAHERRLKSNGLRRIRSYELINQYSFDLTDLNLYETLKLNTDNSATFSQGWKRYIAKLCTEKER